MWESVTAAYLAAHGEKLERGIERFARVPQASFGCPNAASRARRIAS